MLPNGAEAAVAFLAARTIEAVATSDRRVPQAVSHSARGRGTPADMRPADDPTAAPRAPGAGGLRGLLRRAAGNALVLAHLPGQHTIPYATRARVEALRDARIARMVRFAARTVPHYRDLFARLGIDPRDVRTADDLARLPLLDKDELRRAPERFVATSRAGRTAIPFVTSGSSGGRGGRAPACRSSRW